VQLLNSQPSDIARMCGDLTPQVNGSLAPIGAGLSRRIGQDGSAESLNPRVRGQA
jgi:hypothetical protein